MPKSGVMSKKAIRVLLTSVGRRVELVQALKNSAERLGVNLVLYGADITDTAPALYFCDKREKVCYITDINYIPQLLSICEREQIDALIPTIDTDLLMLAREKREFEKLGTKVFVSSEDKIRLCRDKRLTALYLLQRGLRTPAPVDDYTQYAGTFPCFIKPLDGSSSIEAYKVQNSQDLAYHASRISKYIVQPYIEGIEYTVDIFCDYEGNPVFITPRERIAVRSGEVSKTKICQDDRIIKECKKIISDFKPCGALTIQLIRQNETFDDYFIEINPRFGGGAPLSIKAGADSTEALLRVLLGETIVYQDKAAHDGAIYSRFDQSICINEVKTSVIKAVIFDLDDTLYSEKDYVRSGFLSVEAFLTKEAFLIKKGVLWKIYRNGTPRSIDSLLHQYGIYTDELRDKALEVYRTHKPDIALYDGARECIVELKHRGIRLALLTDGRSDGQNKKIDSLGIRELFDEIIITDELGGEYCRKPSDVGFRYLQKRIGIPFEHMLYVADNAEKDFIAPSHLGMRWLQFDNPDGLYEGKQGDAQSFPELVEKIYELTE